MMDGELPELSNHLSHSAGSRPTAESPCPAAGVSAHSGDGRCRVERAARPSDSSYSEVAAQFGQGGRATDVIVLGTGVMYKVTPNVQLDAGMNFGVTHAADAFNPFVGLSARF